MAVERVPGGEQRHTTDDGQDGHGAVAGLPPGPEMMLGIWTSWVKSVSQLVSGESAVGEASRQISLDQITGGLLQGGVQQLGEMLAQDPILRATEEALNANPLRQVIPVDWTEIARSLRTVWLRSLSRPDKAMAAAVEFNMRTWQSALETWNEVGRRWLGLARPDASEDAAAGDKRFAAPEWQSNPAYRTLKELYLLASDWLLRQASDAEDMDPAERQRLNFHLHQFVDAMSPTLLLASNPVALRRAVETGGASLADGVRNLLRDIEQGKLTMVDATAFAPGRNLALTPGKVVLRNKLIELVQYTPTTETVYQVPLMIIPPWINKYYIMDMQPKNSLVRFLVGQGFTVFMLSWRNPDSSMEDNTIEDYMDLGPLAANDAIHEITGSPTINVMGLHRRHLARDDAGMARGQGRRAVQFGNVHGVAAGLHQGRRHSRLSRRTDRRFHRAEDDGARISGQPRDVQHVQPAAQQRPDLVQRGEQLPARPEAARLRPAILE